MSSLAEKAKNAANQAKEAIVGKSDPPKGSAQDAGAKVDDAADQAKEKVQEVKDTVTGTGEAEKVGRKVDDAIGK